ncbi:helix-turn-helix domain-containing protein [Curvibacter delicatus]|jgi:transcriptional regulator with XRE-family HTH domain|uniref:helix-turn-helix domain-containing protein n=1 Tax=Curvibacter delicatus TaxID=80879 RepID=UPI00083409E3|nr:helix-turn-helix transcriptional regulator [Curvibacter delicatus]
MPSASTIQNQFAKALKRVRAATGRTQEDFALVSSRTYISSLERGQKSPTLKKIDELAQVLGIHPLTLLTLSYAVADSERFEDEILDSVKRELSELRRRQ